MADKTNNLDILVESPKLKNPEDYEDPEVLYDRLIETIRKYHPDRKSVV